MSEEVKKEAVSAENQKNSEAPLENVLNKEMSLQEVRVKLDEVDRQIVDLYKQRMALSVQVAESKMRSNRPIRDAQREKQKLESEIGRAHV